MYSHFVLLFLLKVTRSGANGSGTLVDIITLRQVSGTSEGYGSQRLWTAVAWGVGSWGAGKAIDAYGFDAIWWWYYCGTAALLALILGYSTPETLRVENKQPPRGASKKTPGPLETLREFRAFVWADSASSRVRGPGAAIPAAIARASGAAAYPRAGEAVQPLRLGRFFGNIVVASLVMALVESILFLQMEREFHTSRALMGTVTLVGEQKQIIHSRLSSKGQIAVWSNGTSCGCTPFISCGWLDGCLAGTFSEYLPFILSKQLLSRYGARHLMVFSQVVRLHHRRQSAMTRHCRWVACM